MLPVKRLRATLPVKRLPVKRLPVKRTAAAILLLWTTAAPAEILCRDTAGESGVHWSWREIDGRHCWFKSRGAMPPKSELRWEKPQARAKMKEEEAVPPPALPQQHPTGVALLRTRVLPEGMSEVAANWIDGDAPVSLMVAEELSGPAGVGGSWVVPPYNMNASDGVSFAGRFAPVVKSGRPQPN
jgi:FAD/FMN-containing dehydrogenase